MTTRGDRTTLVITDLGVLEPVDGELTLTTLHPGVTVEQVREATGWELRLWITCRYRRRRAPRNLQH